MFWAARVMEKTVIQRALQEALEVRYPLGTLHKEIFSGQEMEAFRRLSAYDLSPVRAKILKEETIPEVLVDQAIREFRRYIGLYLHYGTQDSITMFSEDVDEVWHVCILHTRLYEDFCATILGEYLHHRPFLNGDPNSQANWKIFEEKYTALYGPLPEIWYLKRLRPPYGPAWMKAIQLWLNPTRRTRRTKADVNGGCGCGACGCGGDCG
jgi:hypothetical protein